MTEKIGIFTHCLTLFYLIKSLVEKPQLICFSFYVFENEKVRFFIIFNIIDFGI